MENKAQAILERYNADITRWQERGGQYRDIQPLTINDVLYIKAVLHPTKRKESLDLTHKLVTFLCEKEITTAAEIYTALGLSDNPVLKRLKLFQQLGLVRRESKKYYLPTPRMKELKKKYLKRICG